MRASDLHDPLASLLSARIELALRDEWACRVALFDLEALDAL